MKLIQFACLLATIAAVVASLSLGAPIWVTTLLIISVVVVQLALEYRHFTRTGEVCGSVSVDAPKASADKPANA